ncbi:class I SAM-dependent methyltransferase [Paeniglutamicibacter psychrophenolicus]|uniref:SAM-dependent methyltransferase n=1 Tax=Paeniglutamicibacter psychrophenolicus TaxID=257454 RepID=A0ABS4W956_9MICC|nr:class I SAM-dependent methyltransferase [Paeniglutamicibacter psychrophenolicus]MBP2372739.1 SAM-dependent methyltransferase [Paeniglutamicibacter psychrophenolicus]
MDSAPLRLSPYQDTSFDHGAISRFNAWFFTVLAGQINRYARLHKELAFDGIPPANVVELGAGCGANVGWMPAGVRLYALEPNRRMHDALRKTCSRAGVELVLLPTGAERMPFEDASVDEVVCSLVLCTVGDADAVLAEVGRVLRPGGHFRFVEHIAAPQGGMRGWVQLKIRRPWGWIFEGCDPHRDTLARIEAAGFTSVVAERRKFRRSPFWPVNTAAWGIATR